jgi:hypothetical protein
MGWTAPWYSTAGSGDVLPTRNGGDLRCYTRDGDQVFETYETKWRGIEAMLPTLQLLDLTPYGRQETWEDSPAGWPQDKAGSWWWRGSRSSKLSTRRRFSRLGCPLRAARRNGLPSNGCV